MSVFRPYNYKDGKGVDKDAPQKHGFVIFWEIYFRKFWRFVSVNLIYFAVTYPMLMWAYIVANNYVYNFVNADIQDILPGLSFFAVPLGALPVSAFYALLVISVLLYGPATMGVTYVMRNFAREEHAWVSDVYERGKANWKQGLFFGLADILVTAVLLTNILRSVEPGSQYAVLFLAVKYISVLLLALYFVMRHYFYTIAVTFEMSVRAILKNARLFIVLGFFRNLWALLVCAVAWAVFMLTAPVITIVSIPLLAYSFTGFATVFICYPVVKKYMLDPQLQPPDSGDAFGQP